MWNEHLDRALVVPTLGVEDAAFFADGAHSADESI